MKFKKDDRVRIICPGFMPEGYSTIDTCFVGKNGKVISDGKLGCTEAYDYEVELDGGEQIFLLETELELYDEVSENLAKNLKEGLRFGHPEFYKLLDQMADLHSRKNHDYAGTADPLRNLKASLRIGVDPFTGVMLRLQDKWSRLESFMQSGNFLVKDESVEDTLMDNAVYSLLAIILRREQKNEENKNIS